MEDSVSDMAALAPSSASAFEGVLVGTCVGDALGLPREGLSRRRAQRMFGGPPLRHQFLFRHGMASDDTEHACMAAQALLASRGDPQAFGRSLAWRLRGWMLAVPAGAGFATAQAVCKLWLGFAPETSGVWSAGNGPAMRAAILGVYAGDDFSLLKRLVHVSTTLTHRDPLAEQGALAVALAAAHAAASRGTVIPAEYLDLIQRHLPGTEIAALVAELVAHLASGRSFESYLAKRGLEQGVSGFINHTVPAALFCWLCWPADFRKAVENIVMAGGDTDSTAAIVGGLVGIGVGPGAIPLAWRNRMVEWPRNERWLCRLALQLADHVHSGRTSGRPVRVCWPCLLLRNILFLLVVLLHGVRRLLPPW